MIIEKFPPPKRYLIETDTTEEGIEFCTVVDVTGVEDPVYIIGQESPWIGSTLEQLEEWARAGEYGCSETSIIEQIARIRAEDQVGPDNRS